APSLERVPIEMAHERNLIEVIHAGAPEGTVRDRKACRLDDMRLDAEASGEAQDRAGILRNIGLVKRDPHAGLEPSRVTRHCERSEAIQHISGLLRRPSRGPSQ